MTGHTALFVTYESSYSPGTYVHGVYSTLELAMASWDNVPPDAWVHDAKRDEWEAPTAGDGDHVPTIQRMVLDA